MENEELKASGACHSECSEESLLFGHIRWKGFFTVFRMTGGTALKAFHFLLLLSLIFLSSCHYPRPNLDAEDLNQETRDSLTYLYERHYTWNTNLELHVDSINLACLPVKDCYNMLYRGDRVVVAEFAIHPADSVDSVWVIWAMLRIALPGVSINSTDCRP